MPIGAAVAEPGVKKSAFRPDIQGLRMIAVFAVIADHLFHWPSGGFVGVDVFFVISGFLITSLLLREHERTGTLSFWGFYRRRIKRIVPVAMIVIVATTVGAYFLFTSARFNETFWDGIWATIFLANWHFAAQGTDYFNIGTAVSPLQHYWSLSVEEQFYFVWPWLMLLIFALVRATRGTGRHARGILLGAVAFLSLGSFAWAMWESITSPTWAYFSTLSRAWELGIGALLAVVAGVFTHLPAWSRPFIAWAGLSGIVVAFFTITEDGGGFPAPWAALPVLATALVIIAGTGAAPGFIWPISNPVSNYIGNISYSLYLWHFPFIVFLAPFFPSGSWIYYAVTIACIFATASLSYHLVEDPIRRSRVWEPTRARHSRARQFRQSRAITSIIPVAVIGIVTTALVIAALLPKTPPISTSKFAEPSIVPSTPTGTLSLSEELADEIATALVADVWPDTTPAVADASSDRAPELESAEQCMHPANLTDPDICTFGEGDKTALILGDSVSVAWMPGLRAALEPSGYRVRAIGYGSCPFVMAEVVLPNRPDETARCNNFHEAVLPLIEQIDPDIVILSNNQGGYGTLVEGSTEWVRARADALDAVSSETRRVFILEPPPVGKVPSECATPLSVPADCESTVGSDWRAMTLGDETAAAATGASVINTESWFCLDGQCPIFVGDSPVRTDQIHLTATYSTRLAPLLAEYLLG
ncbi:SGNH hydrolase domain-containing protein [Microbacterium sediminicola]|uniref:SGNH hydrolase domain-containing protein n=1 Tax=Microbacterium sediminicola TaxID=415210 RepID=A0ABN2HGD5_9MICO